MEQAVKYADGMAKFKQVLDKTAGVQTVEVKTGRRFDRVAVDGQVRYFVDRHSWEIYGAKSSFQFNPRRIYGKLETVDQFDWITNKPIDGTPASIAFYTRESDIQKNYKPRGRPKKVKP